MIFCFFNWCNIWFKYVFTYFSFIFIFACIFVHCLEIFTKLLEKKNCKRKYLDPLTFSLSFFYWTYLYCWVSKFAYSSVIIYSNQCKARQQQIDAKCYSCLLYNFYQLDTDLDRTWKEEISNLSCMTTSIRLPMDMFVGHFLD